MCQKYDKKLGKTPIDNSQKYIQNGFQTYEKMLNLTQFNFMKIKLMQIKLH